MMYMLNSYRYIHILHLHAMQQIIIAYELYYLLLMASKFKEKYVPMYLSIVAIGYSLFVSLYAV